MIDKITHERLLELLHYDPSTGIFTRKISLSPRVKVGDRAGSKTRDYRELSVDGHIYSEHVLAWFYCKKQWPSRDIDHKNRDGMDNRIDNLREATEQQNGYNSKKKSTNKSGFKGVTLHQGKYIAAIHSKGKRTYLGIFKTPEEAALAYDTAAEKIAADFAATNKELGYL